MSETPNRFAAHNTDSLVAYVREIAKGYGPAGHAYRDQLDAAADRLFALYHAEPKACSAGVLSESDAVRRERKAYQSGAEDWVTDEVVRGVRSTLPNIKEKAARRFRLPQVERPRVVTDGSKEWRIENGEVQVRYSNTWQGHCREYITTARIALLADLLANPTELVDAESPDAR